MRKRILGFLLVPVAAMMGVVVACGDDDNGGSPDAGNNADVNLPDTGSGTDATGNPDTGGGDGAIPYLPNPVVAATFQTCRPAPPCPTWEHGEGLAILRKTDAGFGSPVASIIAKGRAAEVNFMDGGFNIIAEQTLGTRSQDGGPGGAQITASPPRRSIGIAINAANEPFLAFGTLPFPPAGPNATATGIYKGNADGTMTKVDLGATPFSWVPALDFVGVNLYIGDSNGIIYKMTPDGTVTNWSENALFVGDQNACKNAMGGNVPVVTPRAFGIYALTHDGNNLYVGNHDYGSIIRVPIEADGSAGTPVAVLPGITANNTECSTQGIKGIAKDPKDGAWYFTSATTQKIFRANADFTNVKPFVEGATVLDGPAGIAVDVDPTTQKRRLVVVNAAIASATQYIQFDAAAPRPNVLTIDLP
jgi:hypothetical protein